MNRRIILLIVIVELLLKTTLVAQEFYNFRQLTINEGLAHTDANCFVQDDLGFIWIGTFAGLQKYDGQNLTLFTDDSIGITQAGKRIYGMQLQGHILWLRTEYGIRAFDLLSEQFVDLTIHGDVNFQKQIVSTLYVDCYKNLWIATDKELYLASYSEDLKILEIKSVANLFDNKNLERSYKKVRAITGNNQGIIWFITDKRLYGVSISKNQDIKVVQELTTDGTLLKERGILTDIKFHKGNIWLVYYQGYQVLGLQKQDYKIAYNIKSVSLNQFKKKDQNWYDAKFYKMILDHRDNMWISSQNGLWNIIHPLSDKPQSTLYQKDNWYSKGLSTNHFSELFLDSSLCLWIGSWGGGANLIDLNQKRFSIIPEKSFVSSSIQGLNSGFVRDIKIDKDDKVWIATKEGGVNVYSLTEKKIEYIAHNKNDEFSVDENDIRCLFIEKDYVVAGSFNAINIIDKKSKKVNRIKINENLPFSNTVVYDMVKDSWGRYWLAAWGEGVFVMDIDRTGVKSYKKISAESDTTIALSSNMVTNFLYDQTKREMYVSTRNGVNRLFLDELGTIKFCEVYKFGNKGSGQVISDFSWPLLKYNDSTLFVGTLGSGLARVNLKQSTNRTRYPDFDVKIFGIEEGAPGTDIESMLLDNEGNIWLAGFGISRFNVKEEKFWNFNINDGLPTNGYKIGAAVKDEKTGRLFFGSIDGVTYFYPSEIRANNIPPGIAFTSLRIKGKRVSVGEEMEGSVILHKSIGRTSKIKLNHHQNDFSLNFAALHYANPGNSEFEYILEGYDDRWKYLSNHQSAQCSYSNLPAGDYVIKVRCTNNDGVFNTECKELEIEIVPPWYFSKAGYSLYAFIVLLIAGSIFYIGFKWIEMQHNVKLIAAEEKKKEEIHQTKLQFFTNVSHELKTPLSLIITPAKKMLGATQKGSDNYNNLKLIVNNANTLLNQVNELLQFRKAESGVLKLKVSKCNVDVLVKSIYHDLKSLMVTKGIKYQYACEENLEVWADKEKVIKIIRNLLSNSIKYVSTGDMISLSLQTADGKPKHYTYNSSYSVNTDINSDKYLVVKITDTGKGIPEKSLSKVFERFYQVGNHVSSQFGVGIGLSMVKTLVLIHQGWLVINSDEGKGTEIIIGLPAEQSSYAENELDLEYDDEIIDDKIGEVDNEMFFESAKYKNHELDVLLVEDNDNYRKFIEQHLSEQYNVKSVPNGKVAIEVLKDGGVDLIISDVMMPEVDGIELLKKIKSDVGLNHIPVILLTAKSSVESQIEGVESGADLYISKPVDLELFDAQIKRLFESIKSYQEQYKENAYTDKRGLVRNKKDENFLEELKCRIEEQMEDDSFVVATLAKELGIGRTKLYQKIKFLTGMTPVEFLRNQRLQRAASLLMSGDKMISEVMYQVGISSHSYFSKAFKTKFGVTPSEFIKKKN